MESFQSHLSGRLSNTLSSQSAYCLSGLYNWSIDSLNINFKEKSHLHVSDSMETVSEVLLILFIFAFEFMIIFFQIIGFVVKVNSQFLYDCSFEFIIKTHNLIIFNNVCNL